MEFEKFLSKYKTSIDKMAYNLSISYTSFSKEDLSQEAYCHLWELFRLNKIEGKNDSYLLKSSWFHLKNFLRKNQAKVISQSLDMPIGDEDETLKEIIPDKRTALKVSLERISSKVLVEEIGSNGLTAREREVFFLCLKGYTTREIGNMLNISHVRVVKIQRNIGVKYRHLIN